MKYLWVLALSLIVLLVLFTQLPVTGLRGEEKSPEAMLEKADAMEALAIANQWKWTNNNIKSHVNSREVVFQFPNGKVKKIPLSKEKMVVAVAPYVKGTHT